MESPKGHLSLTLDKQIYLPKWALPFCFSSCNCLYSKAARRLSFFLVLVSVMRFNAAFAPALYASALFACTSLAEDAAEPSSSVVERPQFTVRRVFHFCNFANLC